MVMCRIFFLHLQGYLFAYSNIHFINWFPLISVINFLLQNEKKVLFVGRMYKSPWSKGEITVLNIYIFTVWNLYRVLSGIEKNYHFMLLKRKFISWIFSWPEIRYPQAQCPRRIHVTSCKLMSFHLSSELISFGYHLW